MEAAGYGPVDQKRPENLNLVQLLKKFLPDAKAADDVYQHPYLLNMACRSEAFIYRARRSKQIPASRPALPFRETLTTFDDLFTDIVYGGFAAKNRKPRITVRLGEPLATSIDPYLKLALVYWSEGLLRLKWTDMYKQNTVDVMTHEHEFQTKDRNGKEYPLPVNIYNDQALMLLYHVTIDALPDELEYSERDPFIDVHFHDIFDSQRATANRGESRVLKQTFVTTIARTLRTHDNAAIAILTYNETTVAEARDGHHVAIFIHQHLPGPHTMAVVVNSIVNDRDKQEATAFLKALGIAERNICVIEFKQDDNYCAIYAISALAILLKLAQSSHSVWTSQYFYGESSNLVELIKGRAAWEWNNLNDIWGDERPRRITAQLPTAAGSDVTSVDASALLDVIVRPVSINSRRLLLILGEAIAAKNIGPMAVRTLLISNFKRIAVPDATEMDDIEKGYYFRPFYVGYPNLGNMIGDAGSFSRKFIESSMRTGVQKSIFNRLLSDFLGYMQWLQSTPRTDSYDPENAQVHAIIVSINIYAYQYPELPNWRVAFKEGLLYAFLHMRKQTSETTTSNLIWLIKDATNPKDRVKSDIEEIEETVKELLTPGNEDELNMELQRLETFETYAEAADIYNLQKPPMAASRSMVTTLPPKNGTVKNDLAASKNAADQNSGKKASGKQPSSAPLNIGDLPQAQSPNINDASSLSPKKKESLKNAANQNSGKEQQDASSLSNLVGGGINYVKSIGMVLANVLRQSDESGAISGGSESDKSIKSNGSVIRNPSDSGSDSDYNSAPSTPRQRSNSAPADAKAAAKKAADEAAAKKAADEAAAKKAADEAAAAARGAAIGGGRGAAPAGRGAAIAGGRGAALPAPVLAPAPARAPEPVRRNPDDAYFDNVPMDDMIPGRAQLMQKVDDNKADIIAVTSFLAYREQQRAVAEEAARWQNVIAEYRQQRRQQRIDEMQERRRRGY